MNSAAIIFLAERNPARIEKKQKEEKKKERYKEKQRATKIPVA
jgi:hypothetical protein